MSRWCSTLTLWEQTIDRRRIAALIVDERRPLPVPVLVEQELIGRVDSITLSGSTVTFEGDCVWEVDDPHREHSWFAGPDLDVETAKEGALTGSVRMTGRLAGMSFSRDGQVWPYQWPVEFRD